MIEFERVGHILDQNNDICQFNAPLQRINSFKYENFTNFKMQKYQSTENAVLGTF